MTSFKKNGGKKMLVYVYIKGGECGVVTTLSMLVGVSGVSYRTLQRYFKGSSIIKNEDIIMFRSEVEKNPKIVKRCKRNFGK
jgi:hypothetical protein